jgi:uroporphyrinogen-III decarboxylase
MIASSLGETPRQRFLDLVRGAPDARPVISPFLPKPEVVAATLEHLGLPVVGDPVADEIRLACQLDYEPMFMTDCHGLIFPWREDPGHSDEESTFHLLDLPDGTTWTRRISRRLGEWGDESGFPVQSEADHDKLIAVCSAIEGRVPDIRAYFRRWRQRVGEEGVLVIGHPHVTWLAYQIGPQNLIYHPHDYPEAFARSMEAIYDAALAVFAVAMEEGIDFMSESGYGLEMTSCHGFDAQDLPYLQRLSRWTHERGGLFWYHNCGMTRQMILSGRFDAFAPDIVETVAPPPEGDNDLAESRRHLDASICSKGNLALGLLRDGSVEEVVAATRAMARNVAGWRHIHSTADAVLPGTPPENLIAFVRTAREES